MKTKKILCMCGALLGLWMLTSCDKVAEEILDLAGVNKFKEKDTIFQQVDGTIQRNVLSATIKGDVGDQFTLFIGNVNTKQPSSYQKAKWASDETTVATVSPATGNSTMVSLLAEGTALITVTDSEGNMLTTTVVVEDHRLRFAYDDVIMDEEGNALSTGLHIAKSCYVGETYTLRVVRESASEEEVDFSRVQWTQEDERYDGSAGSVVTLNTTEGGAIVVTVVGVGSSRIRAIDDFGNIRYCDLHCTENTGGDDSGDEGDYGGDDGGYGGDDGGYGDLDVFDTNDVIINSTTNAIISGTTIRGVKGQSIEVFIGDRYTKAPDYLRNITWSRSKPRVCSFSLDSGYSIQVNFDQTGECDITATDEKGNTRSFTVSVTN